MDKVSTSQPCDHGFEPHTIDKNDSLHDTSTGWFQEADSRVIHITCWYNYCNDVNKRVYFVVTVNICPTFNYYNMKVIPVH